jgi:hypothetical protein
MLDLKKVLAYLALASAPVLIFVMLSNLLNSLQG